MIRHQALLLGLLLGTLRLFVWVGLGGTLI